MTARLAPLALLFVFAACTAEPSGTSASGPEQTPDGTAPDTAMVREVSADQTSDLVRSAPGQVSPSVAIQTIDLWITRLDTASVNNGAEIQGDLTTLRNLLQSFPLDGWAIGQTMTSLASATKEADSSDVGLRALAAALREAGERLAPAPKAPDSLASDSAVSR